MDRQPHRFRMATFNTYNLSLPGKRFHGSEELSPTDYRKKVRWIADQLVKMDADVVAFQEIFHRQALEDAVKESGIYPHAFIEVADETGDLPRVALVSRLPVRGFQVRREFPAAAQLVPGQAGFFQRPVIQAWVGLPGGRELTVLAVHLKSKRPVAEPGSDRHDPLEEAKGAARALVQRAQESVALRRIVLEEIQGTNTPLVLMGDLNDSTHSVTSDILMGRQPQKNYPHDVKLKLWDTLLYSTNDIQIRKSFKDVYYTHLHDSQYESLDHILVSQEFYSENPQRIGSVEYLRVYNDHLLDPSLSDEKPPVWTSDHAQVVVGFKLKG